MQHNYSLKKLKFSLGAQTITGSALKFSGYVLNMAEKQQKTNTIMH